MTQADPSTASDLEGYRAYLTVLARTQLNPRLRDRVDLSGIIQETMLEALKDWEQFRGRNSAQRATWLRRILAHNLDDALRALRCAKRDVDRERSLEDQLAQSSAGLANWLAADQSSPSRIVGREERAVRVASALCQLTEAQHEAIVLHYWHGCSLADIAAHLERTPAAVAGLLKRGLQELRKLLADTEAP